MYIDADTLLVTVYTIVDDVYQAEFGSLRSHIPGPKPEMSDSEVLTLVILGQWQLSRSERAFVEYACLHWRQYFPRLLSQSEFNRRARSLAGVLCKIGPLVVKLAFEQLEMRPVYEVVDGVPVRLMKLCRGHKARLFACEAGVGRGGSDKEWFYGVRLLLSVNNEGFIDGFVYGSGSTEERWLAEALFRWRVDPNLAPPTAEEMLPILGPSHRRGGKREGPTGPIWSWMGVGQATWRSILADKGFVGKKWIEHWRTHYHANVIVQTRFDDLPRVDRHQAHRWLHGLRQIIETVNNALDDTFGLQFPRARQPDGLLTRLAAKVCAFNLAVYINKAVGHPTFSMPSPYA